MNRRFAILLICLLFPIGLLSSVVVLAEISVGVKEGDWIEYNVTYTGSPPDSYPTWVRIDIQSVQGTSITINVRRELLNGTLDTRQLTFDLESGAEDLIIIPANLNNGDSFYHEAVGNITISGVEDETYAGVKRTVVYATGTQIMLYWDKATGVLLEAIQSTANLHNSLLRSSNYGSSSDSGHNCSLHNTEKEESDFYPSMISVS